MSDRPSMELADLSVQALAREAAQPAVEFQGRWLHWGEMRHVADRLRALLDASGAGPSAPVVFIPRNRPSAIAALLGLVAASRTIRMVYAFQSPAGIARDVERLDWPSRWRPPKIFPTSYARHCKHWASPRLRSEKWTRLPCRAWSERAAGPKRKLARRRASRF